MASTQLPVQQKLTASRLHLPPPQTFDILPPLHELLARIDHSTTDPVSNINLPEQTTSDPEDIGALYSELQPLEPKELPTEVLQIKAKIRKALKELEKLPDMERSVEEQNEEIEALEGRIRRQREMVARLAELAKGVKEKIG
jgi:predicted RNase H-like nuclease (RuvC/YqgF family)